MSDLIFIRYKTTEFLNYILCIQFQQINLEISVDQIMPWQLSHFPVLNVQMSV